MIKFIVFLETLGKGEASAFLKRQLEQILGHYLYSLNMQEWRLKLSDEKPTIRQRINLRLFRIIHQIIRIKIGRNASSRNTSDDYRISIVKIELPIKIVESFHYVIIAPKIKLFVFVRNGIASRPRVLASITVNNIDLSPIPKHRVFCLLCWQQSLRVKSASRRGFLSRAQIAIRSLVATLQSLCHGEALTETSAVEVYHIFIFVCPRTDVVVYSVWRAVETGRSSLLGMQDEIVEVLLEVDLGNR